MDAIYVHDPTAMAAVLAPELFTWEQGQARHPLTAPTPPPPPRRPTVHKFAHSAATLYARSGHRNRFWSVR